MPSSLGASSLAGAHLRPSGGRHGRALGVLRTDDKRTPPRNVGGERVMLLLLAVRRVVELLLPLVWEAALL